MLYPPAILDDDEEGTEEKAAVANRSDGHEGNGFDEVKTRKMKSKSNADTTSPSKSRPTATNFGATSFGDMKLCRPLLRTVCESGFMEPTPIQSATIPSAMAGRDICACSATGTGKTAAFMLPILERLFYRPSGDKPVVRVLILEPTRELASQVFGVGQQLASRCALKMCLCTGGVDARAQEETLRSGADVIIATPGRLIDLVTNTKTLSKALLRRVEVLVLDEADRMLDEAFEDQMRMLIRLCPNRRQTMLFSATMTDEIKQLACLALVDPVEIFVNEANKVGDRLVQEYIRIRKGREEDREAVVAALVKKSFPNRTLVFVKTKLDCDRINAVLQGLGVAAAKLHGDIPQHQRSAALARFREAEIGVLCCTDVAARGLDIVGVKTVINMHVPTEFKNYIHRVGRTARAGAAGRSISLIGENERSFFRRIAKLDSKQRLVQRKIPIDILVKFKQRIDALEPEERCEEESDDVQIDDELSTHTPIAKQKGPKGKKSRKLTEKISP